LATLQSIAPGWHRVLEAGGLVLILPSSGERQARIRNVDGRQCAPLFREMLLRQCEQIHVPFWALAN
jgi:hypothetical protein